MTLSDLCLRRPVLATVMSILIVILGIASLTRMPVRELPDTSTAQVTVERRPAASNGVERDGRRRGNPSASG